jgi:hypothetical protein
MILPEQVGLITILDLNQMINNLIIGRIYHVVNKTTGAVVKVGSTIRTLEKRWACYDKNFSNHFLRLVKEIQSSDLDWYDSESSDCPFLWHLAAAEHMEIVRRGTFNNGPLSNKISPLVQKYVGFDANEFAKAGGVAAGAKTRDEKLGIHNPKFDRVNSGRKGGLANVVSGHLQRISSAGGKVSGLIQGRKHAENKTGICGRSYEKMLSDSKKSEKARVAGARLFLHTRWHVNRGVASPTCKHCLEIRS